MFILGVFVGLMAPYAVRAVWTIYKADAILKDIVHTSSVSNLRFMAKCAALTVEQYLTNSLVYDANKKRYIVSFCIKGALHQLYIKPALGPSARRETDPMKRGYGALDTEPSQSW